MQLLPLLHYLMNNDITLMYESAPGFMRRDYLQGMLAEPLQVCVHSLWAPILNSQNDVPIVWTLYNSKGSHKSQGQTCIIIVNSLITAEGDTGTQFFSN